MCEGGERTPIEQMTDLGVLWDPGAARLAWVLVSDGRIEIVLARSDHDWVDKALDTIAAKLPVVVVAGPDPS